MDSANGFLFSDEDYAALNAPLCQHDYRPVVSPRDVQYAAQDNDMEASSPQEDEDLFNQFMDLDGPRAVDDSTVQAANRLTYNAGDHEYYGDDSPQIQERQETLQRDYNEAFANSYDTIATEGRDNHYAQHQPFQQDYAADPQPMYDDMNNYAGPQPLAAGDPEEALRRFLDGENQSNAAVSPQSVATDHPFTCHICGSIKCNSTASLKRHVARHMKDAEPLYCPYEDCDKHCEKPTDLTRHINSVHLKLQPFNCPHCLKGFSRNDNRNRHVTTCKYKD